MHNTPQTLSFLCTHGLHTAMKHFHNNFVIIQEFLFETGSPDTAHSLLSFFQFLVKWNLISRLFWSEEMLQDQHSGRVCKFNPWLKRNCSQKCWHYRAKLRLRRNTCQWNIHTDTAAHTCLSQWRKPLQMAAVYLQAMSSTVWHEKWVRFPRSDCATYVGTMRICCLHQLVLSSACKIFLSFDGVIT